MNEKRILIIEDDHSAADEIKEKLESLGYKVLGIVEAGNEVVSKIEETRPDLVLMDIMLRGKMEGPLLAAVIRSRFDVPVVYLSGLSDKKILEWANMKETAQTVPFEIDEKDLFTTIELAFFKQHIEKKLNFENLQNLPVDSDEKRFWNIVENAGDAMFVVNPESFVYINKAFENLTGYSREEICRNGFNFSSFVPDQDITSMLDAGKDSEKEKEEADGREFKIVTREGDEKFVEASIRRINEFGEKATVGILRDITERKKREESQQKKVHKLHEALESIINLMVSVAEMKDPYTVGHQRRVSHLACAMAEEMGLEEDRVECLRLAGIIHDIGKLIQVPSETLKKAGDLADVEFSMIKMHPQIAYDLLKTIEFPYPISQVILQHHERMDGSGYPQGLKGDDIQQEARILAVADVVEAMASPRSFRPAGSIEKALEEITAYKGILYDEEAVTACLKLFKEKNYTFPPTTKKSRKDAEHKIEAETEPEGPEEEASKSQFTGAGTAEHDSEEPDSAGTGSTNHGPTNHETKKPESAKPDFPESQSGKPDYAKLDSPETDSFEEDSLEADSSDKDEPEMDSSEKDISGTDADEPESSEKETSDKKPA